MKGEAEKLNVQITQSQSLLKIIHQTTHLGNKKVTHSDNVELPLGFEPLYNQHLIPPSFPREMTIRSPCDLLEFFSPTFLELKLLLKMFTLVSFQQFLDFFRFYSAQNPGLLSRSLSYIIFLPTNRKVIGRYMMSEIVQQSISANVKISLDFSLPKSQYFLSRATKVLWSVIQVYCFNRAKQREKMEFEFEALGVLNWELEISVRKIQEGLLPSTANAERYVLGVSHSWLVYQTCILMEDFLLRGFELGLYADYELQYIHWYLAEAILPCAVRSLACYQEINIKTKKGKKLKTEKLEYEMQLHHIRILLSQAFFLSVSALLSKEKIQKPQIISTQIGNRQNTRYTHRFAPFMHIKTPSYMAFGQFEDIRKSHDSAHTPERLLAEASQIFGSLKGEISKIGTQTEDLKYYARVALTNSVTCKILSGPNEIPKKVFLEYGTKTTPYPILKLI